MATPGIGKAVRLINVVVRWSLATMLGASPAKMGRILPDLTSMIILFGSPLGFRRPLLRPVQEIAGWLVLAIPLPRP